MCFYYYISIINLWNYNIFFTTYWEKSALQASCLSLTRCVKFDHCTATAQHISRSYSIMPCPLKKNLNKVISFCGWSYWYLFYIFKSPNPPPSLSHFSSLTHSPLSLFALSVRLSLSLFLLSCSLSFSLSPGFCSKAKKQGFHTTLAKCLLACSKELISLLLVVFWHRINTVPRQLWLYNFVWTYVPDQSISSKYFMNAASTIWIWIVNLLHSPKQKTSVYLRGSSYGVWTGSRWKQLLIESYLMRILY